MKWKHFQRYWPFVWGIHWSPVNSPHKVQWCRALIFSLILILTNGWVQNWEACDLRCHRSHYDVTVMTLILGIFSNVTSLALGQSYAGLLRAQGPGHGIPENRPFWNYPWGPNGPHQMEEFIFVFLWWEPGAADKYCLELLHWHWGNHIRALARALIWLPQCQWSNPKEYG